MASDVEEQKQSLLAQVMAPFIEGAQHTVSSVMGDLADKGIAGTLWSGANQAVAGAPHVFMPKVPVYAYANPEAAQVPSLAARLGINPEAIKQVGSQPMGSLFAEQMGGDVAKAIGQLIRQAKSGRMPK